MEYTNMYTIYIRTFWVVDVENVFPGLNRYRLQGFARNELSDEIRRDIFSRFNVCEYCLK